MFSHLTSPAMVGPEEIVDYVRRRVHECYWQDDVNCATASLRILSEIFHFELSPQVIDAAVGMHGAGKYGAQCGLVEGTLMFVGLLGRRLGTPKPAVVASCKDFASQFENNYGSLSCRVLRPEGFAPNNPPHLCEKLTCEAIGFSVGFVMHCMSVSESEADPNAA